VRKYKKVHIAFTEVTTIYTMVEAVGIARLC